MKRKILSFLAITCALVGGVYLFDNNGKEAHRFSNHNNESNIDLKSERYSNTSNPVVAKKVNVDGKIIENADPYFSDSDEVNPQAIFGQIEEGIDPENIILPGGDSLARVDKDSSFFSPSGTIATRFNNDVQKFVDLREKSYEHFLKISGVK